MSLSRSGNGYPAWDTSIINLKRDTNEKV